jgi:hypothetical protein
MPELGTSGSAGGVGSSHFRRRAAPIPIDPVGHGGSAGGIAGRKPDTNEPIQRKDEP